MSRRWGHKYHAQKTEVDGHVFDSKREAAYYQELKLREKAGEIIELELQPRYKIEHCGVKICDVVLDFYYFSVNPCGRHHVDVKGIDTPVSRLKRKLLLAFYGITVEIVK